MENFIYTIEVTRQWNGSFAVTVPALPGCVARGTDFAHAVSKAREAIGTRLSVLEGLGQPIPEERRNLHSVTLGVQVSRPART